MAKIQGAFMSIHAEGNFANLLTAFNHSGRAYMMARKGPRKNRKNPGTGFGLMFYGPSFYGFSGGLSLSSGSQFQDAHRYLFKQSFIAYDALTTEQKEELDVLARPLRITGLNLFTRLFVKELM